MIGTRSKHNITDYYSKKAKAVLFGTTFFLALCSLVFTFQSCGYAPKENNVEGSEFDLITAKSEIEEVNKTFMKFIAEGDSIAIADLYTTDAMVMFSGAPAVVGRANIQTLFSGILNSGVTRINFTTEEVLGTEATLVERGEAIVYVQDQIVAEEKYLIIWKKEEGVWKLFRDIANSNLPSE